MGIAPGPGRRSGWYPGGLFFRFSGRWRGVRSGVKPFGLRAERVVAPLLPGEGGPGAMGCRGAVGLGAEVVSGSVGGREAGPLGAIVLG